jgi:hypothetical protein
MTICAMASAESLHIRDAPDTDQDFIDGHIVLPAMRSDHKLLGTILFLSAYIFPAAQQGDTFARHSSFNNLGCITIFLRENAMECFDEVHLTSKTSKGLREFASDRPSPNHAQAAGQCRQ